MSEEIKYISKVVIHGLWNRYDLEWNLNPDVNVLSGINGSGKSTILNALYEFWSGGIVDVKRTAIGLEVTNNFGDTYKWSMSTHQFTKPYSPDGMIPPKAEEMFHSHLSDPVEFSHSMMINKISTFDTIIKGEIPDSKVKTNLDRDLFYLEKKFLNYKLNVGNRAFEAVNKLNGSAQEEVVKIRKQLDHFLDIIDYLFENTDKKLNRKKNDISFLSGEDEITPYQLSSGEKQMLVILLTVLVQDNKPSILFMDEPEISLHFDWQKKLIGYIRELNPNCQVILATHSPAVVMEGWTDKVSDVRDLITLDRLAVAK